ncbi:helix-turn-helix domain-containing protein [Sphingomonas sp. DT-207]|uniref:helix-turn-helix domain-containing protein n=1 Tax=Sphingomonas sp. DT-207 TaxID=3396167 RepID=UPI003F541FD0
MNAPFAGGAFDTGSRAATPLVEGFIRTSHDMLFVTLTGGARQLEVRADCGHRFQGPETMGAVSFVPAGCERRFVLQDVRSRWASISLPTDMFSRLWPDTSAPSAGAFTNERHPFVVAAVAECARLHRLDGDFDPAYAESMAAALVHYLSRRHGALPDERTASRLTDRQMRAVQDYIRTHIGQPISVSALATVAGVSTGHFFRSFRETSGMTPLACLQRMRIARAAEILEDEAASVTEAALRVGFSNLGHFTRVFAGIMGVLPSDYRRAARTKRPERA